MTKSTKRQHKNKTRSHKQSKTANRSQNNPRRLLIVDGYNVLRSGARYQNIMAPSPDYADDYYNQAREMLINDVASFAGDEYRATVVFDAAGNEFSTGSQETIGGVRVVFSPAGRSADEIIEKLAHDARRRDIEVLVVSSDASIQETVFAGHVTRMSANDFSYNMNSYSVDSENVARVEQWNGELKKTSASASNGVQNGATNNNVANNSVRTAYVANPATANASPKNTIADRISPDQLEKLKRLRDGKI